MSFVMGKKLEEQQERWAMSIIRAVREGKTQEQGARGLGIDMEDLQELQRNRQYRRAVQRAEDAFATEGPCEDYVVDMGKRYAEVLREIAQERGETEQDFEAQSGVIFVPKELRED
jgi:hypothetical protein